jgi:mevalonate kinase
MQDMRARLPHTGRLEKREEHMKQDEMIAMLKRVIKENQNYTTCTVSTPHLMQLVNNAIELEREACAIRIEHY